MADDPLLLTGESPRARAVAVVDVRPRRGRQARDPTPRRRSGTSATRDESDLQEVRGPAVLGAEGRTGSCRRRAGRRRSRARRGRRSCSRWRPRIIHPRLEGRDLGGERPVRRQREPAMSRHGADGSHSRRCTRTMSRPASEVRRGSASRARARASSTTSGAVQTAKRTASGGPANASAKAARSAARRKVASTSATPCAATASPAIARPRAR